MSESDNAGAETPDAVGEIIEKKPVEGAEVADDGAEAPEAGAETPPSEETHEREEPVLDAKDQIIANYERLLAEQGKIVDRATQPAAPQRSALEAKAIELGFGNVGATATSPGIDMVGPLMKLFEIHGQQVGGQLAGEVSGRLDQLQGDVVGTKFERELAVRVQKQTGDFIRFRDAEIARDPTLRVLRSNPNGAAVAAELIASRWRDTKKAVKLGEERRQERLSGAALQAGSPRGGNGANLHLTLKRGDPDFGRKMNEFIERGGDPANFKVVR